MNSRTSGLRPAVLVATALALCVAFAAGFVVAKKQVFPHDLVVALAHSLRPAAEADRAEPAAEPPPREHAGWFERLPEGSAGASDTGPGGEDEAELLRTLDAVGYLNSYGEAGEDSGVTLYLPELAQAGLNLVLSAHEAAAILCDMEGRVLHEWRYPFQRLVPEEQRFGSDFWRRVHLLPDGSLLAVWDRLGMVKLDRDSNLEWSLLGDFHHDLDVTADGTIWVLTREERMLERFSDELTTVEDFITRVSPDGRILGSISLLTAFEDSPYDSFLEKARAGGDIFHTNTLEVFEGDLAHHSPLFAAGKALISLRDLDVIAIVDLESQRIVWASAGMWHGQHEPVVLDNGNMLLFDNMGHRGRSKVIEFQPFTQEVVWSFEGDEQNDFSSKLCGSNQRLPNGNTLITESLRGRAFEVTPEGEIVWRWASPYRVGEDGIAVLMEVIRLPEGTPLDWLER